jgi:purine-binding chemotaxis protein CheW
MQEEGDNAKNIEQNHQFFLFEIDGELYAVLANQVEEVMKIPPITPIPNAPRSIIGIFHLRGKVVVALDLIGRMNMPKSKPLTANYLFVVHHQRNQFAVLIDHPRSIIEVPATLVRAPDPIIAAHVPSEYIEGIFTYEEIFTVHKKERPIIIGPAGAELARGSDPTAVRRPVMWLKIDRLLDHDELSGMIASQGNGL